MKIKLSTKQSNTVFIISIAIVAALSRIGLFLKKYPLGPDDGIYAISSKHVADGLTPFKQVFSSQGGWFLELLALPVRIFNNNFWAPRIIPVIAGMLIAIFAGLIAKRTMSYKCALFTGLICALSGTLIRTTSAITSDGVMTAFSLATILLMYKFIGSQTNMNAIYLGISLGLGCSIKSIFMIPTIIFLFISTYNTELLKRFIAFISAVIIFILPFILFGYKDVWDQSVVYHIEKDDPLNITSNIGKIFSTISTLDIFISIMAIIGIGIFVIKMIKKDSKLHNSEIKLLNLGYLFPTFLLLVFQAPLFRNHLAIIMPAIIIISIYYFSLYKLNKLYEIILVVLLLISSIFTINNVENDSGFKKVSGYKNSQNIIERVKKDKLMLTNDPGFAYFAKMGIPKLLEDTSRYRFQSKTESIKLDNSSFSKYLNNSDICSIVIKEDDNDRIFSIEDILNDKWSQVIQKGNYNIWLNNSTNCTIS
ncbi:MAG: glycosyltransferase family 39 protein [Acidimicrobiia bacterium]|nr:glycosyltransferase family 39 protein [Acidimicrobiia bacterium]